MFNFGQMGQLPSFAHPLQLGAGMWQPGQQPQWNTPQFGQHNPFTMPQWNMPQMGQAPNNGLLHASQWNGRPPFFGQR
jgi:hypothetical protein